MRAAIDFGKPALAVLLIAASATPAHAQAEPTEDTAQENAEPETESPEAHLARLSSAGEVQMHIVSGQLGMDWLAVLLRSYPYFAELEEAHAGLIDHLVQTAQPAFVEIYRASLPGYESELAELFDENLSDEEIGQAIAFFETPTGLLILETQTEINLIHWLSGIPDDPETGPNDPIMRRALLQAQRTLAELPRDEQIYIGEFYRSAAGRKLTELQPRIVELNQALAESSKEALQADMMRITGDAVEEYTQSQEQGHTR